MDTAALSTIPLLALSKVLKPSLKPYQLHLLHRRYISNQFLLSAPTCFWNDLGHRRSRNQFHISFAGNVLRAPPAARGPPRLACISTSSVESGSGGGGDDGVGGGGGGGDGGGSSGGTETKPIAGDCEDASALGAEVIVLDVGGMSCGGCAASVKRILESQPQVSSASVNLATEIAVVWVNSEVKASQNWQQQLGEELAKHLTTCGFRSKVRGQGKSIEGKT